METSLSSKTTSTTTRLADWAVIILTLAALVAGWFIKSGVENRSVAFSGAGISAQIPVGWLTTGAQGNEVLHASDPLASGFGTTYSLENIPIAADATSDQVASMLTLERGQALSDFRVLGQQQVTVFGRAAFEISYVYVESNPNLTHNAIPHVVLGSDYIFLNGNHAIVASYRADEKDYSSNLGRFQRFLGSLKF